MAAIDITGGDGLFILSHISADEKVDPVVKLIQEIINGMVRILNKDSDHFFCYC